MFMLRCGWLALLVCGWAVSFVRADALPPPPPTKTTAPSALVLPPTEALVIALAIIGVVLVVLLGLRAVRPWKREIVVPATPQAPEDVP